MLFPALALLSMAATATVRDAGAPLRDACSGDAETVLKLAGGTQVEIRFAFSGDIGTCYKVTVGDRGGYLLAVELNGLDSFEQGRRGASDVELPQMLRAETTRLRAEAPANSPASGALELMETNRPKQALRLLEDSLAAAKQKDPLLLALAGLAAFKSDDPRRAIAYWTESQELAPNPSIAALLKKARAEVAGDKSLNKLRAERFVVRYDDTSIPERAAAQALGAAGEEYSRLDQALGCGITEQMTLVLQTVDAYRASTGAADWSGGQFDGRIRVVLFQRDFNAQARQALAHELVHACLARNGMFPGWFHEGMAMRWSGERPASQDLNAVRDLTEPPQLGPATGQAQLYYSWSWLAVERMYGRYGEPGMRDLLRRPTSVTVPRAN